jgi:hypothetical protein
LVREYEAEEDSVGDDTADDTEIPSANAEAARYWHRLRDTKNELAATRDQLDALQGRLDTLHRAEAERVAAGSLIEPADLWRDGAELDDIRDRDGNIDPQAVRKLVAARPHPQQSASRSLRFAVAVALVVIAFRRTGPTAPQEATHQRDSRYHGHHNRGNKQRKPNRTMVVGGRPENHDEQHGGEKQHEVTPVLGEVPDSPLRLPTLLLRHEEGLDVLCEHSLERGSTGHLIFRSPLQQVDVRYNEGSQVRNIRTRFARHAAEQKATG